MRYRAFISYSHADEAWARWLMRRLETYRVPSRLVGTAGIDGAIGPRLGAFFRDRDELTAASDLGSTIRAALAESSALVVVCSPAAAASRWVGAEVQAFRDSGRGDRILAFVVDGEPGQAVGEHACFPAALTAPGGDGQPVEPLAADARSTGDGRERAFIKLVAGLLGVGYDQLAQREAQRKQRRLMQVAVASLAGMTLALGLAATAYMARNDAQRRQVQAEDIVGFMLGDLRKKLTTVGRLDLMRAVDDKAAGYFATLDPRDLSDRTLEEQARSLTGIGQVRLDEGNHGEAMAAFREALTRSTALHERAPDDGQRRYDLAQAQFWIGNVAIQQGDYDTSEHWMRQYLDSAVALAAIDPGNFDWQKEVAYGHHNLATLEEKRGNYASAERSMLAVRALYRDWIKQRPADLVLRDEDAESASWLGSLALRQGHLAHAEAYYREQVGTVSYNVRKQPDHADWKERRVASLILLAEALLAQGKSAQARTEVDGGCATAAELTQLDPANNLWRTALGTCRFWQAQVDRVQRSPLASTQASTSASILAQAHQTEPKNERILSWLVRAHQLQAQLQLDARDLDGAKRHLQSAKALIEPAWQAKPTERLRLWMAETLLLEGELEKQGGNSERAALAWSEARRLLRRVMAPSQGAELHSDPERIPFPLLDPLLRTETALGHHDQTTPIRQRLDAAGYVPLQPWPGAPSYPIAAAP